MSSSKRIQRFKADPGNEEVNGEFKACSPTKYTTTNDPVSPKVESSISMRANSEGPDFRKSNNYTKVG